MIGTISCTCQLKLCFYFGLHNHRHTNDCVFFLASLHLLSVLTHKKPHLQFHWNLYGSPLQVVEVVLPTEKRTGQVTRATSYSFGNQKILSVGRLVLLLEFRKTLLLSEYALYKASSSFVL